MRGHIDIPLALDRSSPAPLTVQLVDLLRDAMRTGGLRAGERLPSSRGLAAVLGVSRTVVMVAYQQLYAEGWLEGRHGSGTYVADGALPLDPVRRPARPERRPDGPVRTGAADRVVDLRPGRPWAFAYDMAAWRRAWRAAGAVAPSDSPDPHGHPGLRELLAEHLRRARAVPVVADDIMVTRGTGNGLDLIAAVLLRPRPGESPPRAGVEEPGYRKARSVFAARGAEIVPCPVDEQGVIVEALPDDLRVLYTTPAHQYPRGGRLPIPRRERLLAWARRTGAILVEDDYDAEFRYDVAPLPALYGLDPERVVLLGTLSKSLSPDVGLGWLVASGDLLDRIAHVRVELTDRTPGPVQAAVAALLERGDLDRHLRRMRLEYARRRAIIVETLGPLGPLVRGDTAGLHVMVELPAEVVPGLVERARRHGVLLDTADRHHHGPPRVHGLVLGYGSASRADVRHGCAVIRRLLAAQ
ncbi:MocR-like pyridoxine biosynthesis transcription factor PdxR [Sphaerimonospora thailandensis]|uniref:GntR family transcriptional regulator n=1 Tax=Sphaerimonospora thailandensis TaxID=795644 RepID=A0A8J3VZ64_9ACTN|nr:PLP-dependent aminotransferase family protein [Sphaerimonospora thailandensis]GIH69723.1 GntR family transcriptional regulator [Sphaerimonospora thailandensis]